MKAMRGRVRHRVRHAGEHAKPADAERRAGAPHRAAALIAALTLLALLGRAVADDCKAVQAVLEVWRHLQQIGS